METIEKQLELERQIVAAAAKTVEVVRLESFTTVTIPIMATIAPPGQEYVDPYLFEIGHFKDREEYEELSRTAKIKPRARA